MQYWNIVVSLHERKYVPAWKLLEKLGALSRTTYFNVLVMHVEDMGHLLETLRQWVAEDPQLLTILARVVPVTQTFTFQTVEERFLDGVLMEALEKSGRPGRITFADPDAIMTVETVDCQRACLCGRVRRCSAIHFSVWTEDVATSLTPAPHVHGSCHE